MRDRLWAQGAEFDVEWRPFGAACMQGEKRSVKKSIAAGSIEPRNPRPPALAEQRGRICKRSGAMYGVIATAVAAEPAVHQSIDRSPLVP